MASKQIRRLAAATAVLVSLLFALTSAPSASSMSWTVQQSPNVTGALSGVAATSPSNAWAVGHYGTYNTTDQTLIERWNGTAWNVQTSPNPGVSVNYGSVNTLNGVAATSATNAWAVGYYKNGTGQVPTLIERWNGTAWNVQKSPNPGGNSDALNGVAATSASNAWAVGQYFNGTGWSTLIEHWNGRAWKVQNSPNPDGSSLLNNYQYGNTLTGVAATSRTNAWAVGYYNNGTTSQTLIEHWNGTAWKVQKSPNPSGSSYAHNLYGVIATSATNAWAVGGYLKLQNGGGASWQTLVEHWNGTAWKVQTSPDLNASELYGVTATSATKPWAVGYYNDGTTSQTLIEHWNGTAWNMQTSPNPSGTFNYLSAVAATSASNAWAVGYDFSSTGPSTLVEHWG